MRSHSLKDMPSGINEKREVVPQSTGKVPSWPKNKTNKKKTPLSIYLEEGEEEREMNEKEGKE